MADAAAADHGYYQRREGTPEVKIQAPLTGDMRAYMDKEMGVSGNFQQDFKGYLKPEREAAPAK